MSLARRVASLGLSARGDAGIKVRQPLAKVLAHWESAALGSDQALNDELIAIIKDELNVKAFEFVSDPLALVTYRVLPVNKVLGPRFGKDFPKLRAALASLDPVDVAAKVEAGELIEVALNGETVTLTADEVLVEPKPVEGLAVASDKMVTVAVDTVITPELKAEGLAREIVRRVQAQRKNAGFEVSDRITVWYAAPPELAAVFDAWGGYIQAETLATQMLAAAPPEDAFTETHKIDGAKAVFGLKRNA
jgi:isoleucyl-tRNA synthetase